MPVPDFAEQPNFVEAEEPVLVVVRVPRNDESVLVKSNLAILDTPGLDSALSIWTSSQAEGEKGCSADPFSRYRWIIEATDMAVFLQSSVSALNGSALGVLSLMKNDRKETWLVHNEMRAKYWRLPESTKADEDKQKQSAVEVFDKAGFDRRVVQPQTVNLGKAYDAMSGFVTDDELGPGFRREKLKEESKIAEFESSVNKFLAENSDRIRREHCRRLVEKRVDFLIAATQDTIKFLEGVRDDKERAARELQEDKGKIERFYKDHFQTRPNEVIVENLAVTESLVKENFDCSNDDYGKKDIEKCLRNVDKDLTMKLKKTVEDNTDEKIHIVDEEKDKQSLTDYVQRVFDAFSELLPEGLADEKWRRDRIQDAKHRFLTQENRGSLVAECIRESIPDVETSVSVNVSAALKESRKAPGGIGHRRLKTLWFRKYYDHPEALDIASGCRKNFEKQEKEWEDALSSNIFRWLEVTLRDRLLRKFESALREIVDCEARDLESQRKTTECQIAKLTALVGRMSGLKIKEM